MNLWDSARGFGELLRRSSSVAELMDLLEANRSGNDPWKMIAGSFVRMEPSYAKPLLATHVLLEMGFEQKMVSEQDGILLLQVGYPLASAFVSIGEWLRCHFDGYVNMVFPEISEYGHLSRATLINWGAPWKLAHQRRVISTTSLADEVAHAFGVERNMVLEKLREIDARLCEREELARFNEATRMLSADEHSELAHIVRKFGTVVTNGGSNGVTIDNIRGASSVGSDATDRVREYRELFQRADFVVRNVLQVVGAVATGRVVDLLANERTRWSGDYREVEIESRDPRLMKVGVGALLTLDPDPVLAGTYYLGASSVLFFDGQTPVVLSACALKP